MQCVLTHRSSEDSPYTPASESQRRVYAALLRRLQAEPLRGMVGPDYVTGSHLPSHSDARISCLTGLKIQVLSNGAANFMPQASSLQIIG